METIKKALNNRNIILSGLVILVLGIILIIWIFNLFTNSIQEKEHIWETTLKFSIENESEFPYAVKTQQGNLYAEGPLYANSQLVTNENINGEWLAIKEYKEEYRSHTETYSCNCRTVNGHTNCSTCTRTVWQWEYDGTNYQKVERIKLLGQEMDSKMFNWDGGWLINNYQHVNTKEDKHYLYHNSHKRSSFSVISPGVNVAQGFRSDENGFSTLDIQPNNSSGLKTIRLILTILLSVVLVTGVGCWIYFGYEYYDSYIK